MIDARYMGTLPYQRALMMMRLAWEEAVFHGGYDRIFFLEHPNVLTRGYNERSEDGLRIPADRLRADGIEIHRTDRGGQWTCHGPGQLVIYFVLHLPRQKMGVRRFVTLLEQAIIRLLEEYGAEGIVVPGRPGIWAGSGLPIWIAWRIYSPARSCARFRALVREPGCFTWLAERSLATEPARAWGCCLLFW